MTTAEEYRRLLESWIKSMRLMQSNEPRAPQIVFDQSQDGKLTAKASINTDGIFLIETAHSRVIYDSPAGLRKLAHFILELSPDEPPEEIPFPYNPHDAAREGPA